MPTMQFSVHGHVQGVGYRTYVVRKAMEYAIVGEVWNSSHGGVDMWCTHANINILFDFKDVLRRGPGRVDSIDSHELPETPAGGFTVGPTR